MRTGRYRPAFRWIHRTIRLNGLVQIERVGHGQHEHRSCSHRLQDRRSPEQSIGVHRYAKLEVGEADATGENDLTVNRDRDTNSRNRILASVRTQQPFGIRPAGLP
jgi:hypothetical protein